MISNNIVKETVKPDEHTKDEQFTVIDSIFGSNDNMEMNQKFEELYSSENQNLNVDSQG